MNDVTFIIPSQKHLQINEHVIKNFTDTFKVYFKKINFIGIEQSDDKPFMHGQLFNIAVKYCATEYIGLIDNDIINLQKFDPKKVYKIFNKPFIAFNKISQLIFDKDIYSITKTEDRSNWFGAFIFMKREDFINCNGFSNLCSGWGISNNILDCKLKKMPRLNQTLGHITHPKRNNTNPERTKFNLNILKSYEEGKIDNMLDGLKQTTYFEIHKENIKRNVLKIKVTNIGVTKDFKYIELYNQMQDIKDK